MNKTLQKSSNCITSLYIMKITTLWFTLLAALSLTANAQKGLTQEEIDQYKALDHRKYALNNKTHKMAEEQNLLQNTEYKAIQEDYRKKLFAYTDAKNTHPSLKEINKFRGPLNEELKKAMEQDDVHEQNEILRKLETYEAQINVILNTNDDYKTMEKVAIEASRKFNLKRYALLSKTPEGKKLVDEFFDTKNKMNLILRKQQAPEDSKAAHDRYLKEVTEVRKSTSDELRSLRSKKSRLSFSKISVFNKLGLDKNEQYIESNKIYLSINKELEETKRNHPDLKELYVKSDKILQEYTQARKAGDKDLSKEKLTLLSQTKIEISKIAKTIPEVTGIQNKKSAEFKKLQVIKDELLATTEEGKKLLDSIKAYETTIDALK